MKRIIWASLVLIAAVLGIVGMTSVPTQSMPSEALVMEEKSGPEIAAVSPDKEKENSAAPQGGDRPVQERGAEESPQLKALREQMIKEREVQQQIKMHNLELERTRVQLEQEKAFAEMNQLRKANLGIIRDPSGNGTLSLPDTKVVFLSGSEKSHEAILSINGTNYTVQPGDRPLENVLIKSVSAKGVVIVVNKDKELLLIPNLME